MDRPLLRQVEKFPFAAALGASVVVSVHLFLSTVSGRESVEAFVPLLVRDSTYIRSAQPIGLRIAGRTQSFGSL